MPGGFWERVYVGECVVEMVIFHRGERERAEVTKRERFNRKGARTQGDRNADDAERTD